MKIVVLLKQTPETEAKIVPAADGKDIDRAGMKYIVNPYDDYAVEEALLVQAKHPGTEIVVVSFGPQDMKDRMLKAMAMGADRGLLIADDGLSHLDSLSVAKILAKAVQAEGASLIFCGKQGIDDDNMSVGVMVAELLGMPHVNVVNKLTIAGEKATIEREVEGGQVEVYEASLPLVIGANKALNAPRYAALPGIMKAKKKPFDTKAPKDYGFDHAALLSNMKVKTVAITKPQEKPKGRVFKDQPLEAMVDQVVKLLREEAKVI